MTFDPPTPDNPDAGTPSSAARRDPGGWRTVMIVTWVLTLGALIAVAISSRTIGRPIWWLGPSVDPASPVAVMVPIAVVVSPLVAAARHRRHMGLVGTVSAIALAATSLPDLADKPGVAVAVLTVAVAALCGSVAVLMATRHYR